jgi:hypothetical protein
MGQRAPRKGERQLRFVGDFATFTMNCLTAIGAMSSTADLSR